MPDETIDKFPPIPPFEFLPVCNGGEIVTVYAVDNLETIFQTLDGAKKKARELVSVPQDFIIIHTVQCCKDTGEIISVYGNLYGIGSGLPE